MHQGEIIEKAIRESGVSITKVATKLKISRKTLYNYFDKREIDPETIAFIGQIINYDFSKKLPKLKYQLTDKNNHFTDNDLNYQKLSKEQLKDEIEHWKNKYIQLLEEYTILLRKK